MLKENLFLFYPLLPLVLPATPMEYKLSYISYKDFPLPRFQLLFENTLYLNQLLTYRQICLYLNTICSRFFCSMYNFYCPIKISPWLADISLLYMLCSSPVSSIYIYNLFINITLNYLIFSGEY